MARSRQRVAITSASMTRSACAAACWTAAANASLCARRACARAAPAQVAGDGMVQFACRIADSHGERGGDGHVRELAVSGQPDRALAAEQCRAQQPFLGAGLSAIPPGRGLRR